MDEEEKKAIEWLEKQVLVKTDKNGKITVMSDNILNLIEKQTKELEKWQDKWDKDTHRLQNDLDLANAEKWNNFIPKSKIEERLQKLYQEEKNIYIDTEIQVLQELLEKDV